MSANAKSRFRVVYPLPKPLTPEETAEKFRVPLSVISDARSIAWHFLGARKRAKKASGRLSGAWKGLAAPKERPSKHRAEKKRAAKKHPARKRHL